ncbi:protein adenylyltransferase SelO [Kocuria sp.]|uniref:protein adenylyltransferase SelO n=1 Tax=Kocuria sp. TaxID=1871328 RepID=UPI0026DFB437|nr:YdiU family protein [Kocuria sp.]MDO5619764.1 YdiU family protein [Kocuria sp.]
MTAQSHRHSIRLESTYAQTVPQLSVPWPAGVEPESLVVLNSQLAGELGLDPAFLRSHTGLAWLSGTAVPGSAEPDAQDSGSAHTETLTTYAQAYAGHQFGSFVPQLGDGRAVLLGEMTSASGRVDLHLKGSGRTPFSRGGDGKAPLGPMLREYLVGEAMQALGIPTTRGLAVMTTGEQIQRRQPDLEPGAILTRVAASHLRVGTFQFAAVHHPLEIRRALADYTIQRHWPAAARAHNPYVELLRCVTHAQARLVAQWMLVGFVHGVMNTDNMTMSGEGIDYGPCAFIDTFTRSAVFSSIDRGARYAFNNQPGIALWNLSRFAETLIDLIADADADADPDTAVDAATHVLREFESQYSTALACGFAAKLGVNLGESPEAKVLTQFRAFVEQTFDLMENTGQDFTLFFRAIAEARQTVPMDSPELSAWQAQRQRLIERWAPDGQADPALMQRNNPVYIPRNHHLEQALAQAERGDLAEFNHLLAAVQEPFVRREGFSHLEQPGSTSADFVTFCGT